MYKPLTMGTLITFAMLVGCIAGCGNSDDDPAEKVDEPVKINLLATSPENGGTVPTTGDLRIVFDSSPKSVTVDGRPAIILNNTAIVKITDLPNVIPGTEKAVIIEWKNPDNSSAGAKTITFTVLKPIADTPQPDDNGDDVALDDDEDDDVALDDDEDFGPPSATAVFVDPPPGFGFTLPSNQQFSLTFDQGVTAVSVNGGAAIGAGRNWTVSPNLLEGVTALNVEWTNRDGTTGSQAVGPYVIKNPDVTPPVIAAGTVSDGDWDVDPAPLNAGGFRFDFNEAVTGTVKLTDEAGADLNWIANVAGQKATLTLIAGQELANETTYKIEIDVRDGAGNRTRETITFVTKALE